MPNIQLIPVDRDHVPVLDNLLQLYLYDFSIYFCGEDDGIVDANGHFDPGFDVARYALGRNADGDRFWGWLAQVDGHWAGFALVSDRVKYPGLTDSEGRNVDEFFVMRCYRRQGVGKHMAFRMFDTWDGFWQISQVAENKPSQVFWRTVIHAYTGGQFEDFERVNEWGETVVWQTFG